MSERFSIQSKSCGVQMLLPLLLLIPLHEQPPAKLAEEQQELLPSSAESTQTSLGAAPGAPAGLEGGGAAALSMPETPPSPHSSGRSPGTPRCGSDQGHWSSAWSSLDRQSRYGPRRSLQEPRRSFTFGSSPIV